MMLIEVKGVIETKNGRNPIIFLKAFFWIMLCIFYLTSFAQNVTEQIKLNQLGFYPHAPKIAIVTGAIGTHNFYITSTNLRDTFFSGTLSAEKHSAYSNTITHVADFSPVTATGSFVVLVPGVGHSYLFSIQNHVNKSAAVATLKGYYYQRASMPLQEKYAGKWHRSVGHPDDVVHVHPSAASAERPAGTILSTPGGWYDAGDYNKYVVNSGISMGTLFSAYEDFSTYFDTLNTNIPESEDAVPDILNEAIYNLRWMLTMQDPNDGGVYHKCTNAVFDGMVMPGVTKAPRFVVQKGTAATLDFAAVAAQASRIFSKYIKQLPGLSDSCLKASEKAWQWAVKNPTIEYDQRKMNEAFDPDVTTGAYGDRNFRDEWFWASCELFVTTNNNNYYASAIKYKSDSLTLPSWANVAMLGNYTLLRFKSKLPKTVQPWTADIRQNVLQFADQLISNVEKNAFQTIMGQSRRDFVWGSNANAANQGIVLINAYLISCDKKYINYALTNLDYLLGRNATGYSFVTGIGSKSPMHPHHRQSVSDGVTDPVPGLMAGGPNPGKQDNCTYAMSDPEVTYLDMDCSYSTNEIAINWNAPIVYLANAIEALSVTVFK